MTLSEGKKQHSGETPVDPSASTPASMENAAAGGGPNDEQGQQLTNAHDQGCSEMSCGRGCSNCMLPSAQAPQGSLERIQFGPGWIAIEISFTARGGDLLQPSWLASRIVGSPQLHIPLPYAVQVTSVSAKFIDGVLKIRLNHSPTDAESQQ